MLRFRCILDAGDTASLRSGLMGRIYMRYLDTV